MVKKILLIAIIFILSAWSYSWSQTWQQINTDGFGNPYTGGINMIVFNNSLYAGAANGMSGCKVFRYNGGTSWTQVNADGFGDSNNVDPALEAYEGSLYAIVENNTTGCEIWRSDGGTTWSQINSDGFGDSNNIDAYAAISNNSFYVVTKNDVSLFEVWRYDGGAVWTRIDPGAPGPGNGGFGDTNNVEADSPTVFGGNLYVGTNNGATGGEVWEYNGSSWTQINTDGFGDVHNSLTMDLFVFDNMLYAAALNNWTGCEVWRYDGGASWTQVNTDGFGDPGNYACVGSEGIIVFLGKLYMEITNHNSGCEVWRYDGGFSWTRVDSGAPGSGNGGFGDVNNYEIGNMVVNNGSIYGATVNEDTGCEVWRYDGGTTWTRVDPGAPGPGDGGFGDMDNDYFTFLSFNNVLYGNTDLSIYQYVESSAIPTVSEWGMLLFSIMLVGSTFWITRSRKGRR